MIEWEQNPPEESMYWDDAMKHIKSLGKGWRLPTIEELKSSYDKSFTHCYYWVSSIDNNHNKRLSAYCNFIVVENTLRKHGEYYVRCVRKIEQGENYERHIQTW